MGKRCKFIDVRGGHYYVGKVKSLFWFDDLSEHCFGIEADKNSEKEGFLAIWKKCFKIKKQYKKMQGIRI